MASTNNVLMKQYNGEDYDIVYPQTTGENIVTPVPLTAGGGGGETATDSMYNLMSNISNATSLARMAVNDYMALVDISESTVNRVPLRYLGTYLNTYYGVKIKHGQYTGSGTYGSSNKNSLSLGFVPSILIVSELSEGIRTNSTGQWTHGFVAVFPTSSYSFTIPVGTDAVSGTLVMSAPSDTVNWYSTSAAMQCNNSSSAYTYVAIG